MARTTRRDWLEAGLGVVGDMGADALTIDALTARIGVTKGSFYHHFASFQEYKDGLLAFFEREETLDIIARVEDEGAASARDKMHHLIDVVVAGSSRIEVGIRAWALRDAEARTYQERIDGRRLAYLREVCAALTNDEPRALVMARVCYALYVGCEQIVPPIEGDDRRRMFDAVMRLYGLS